MGCLRDVPRISVPDRRAIRRAHRLLARCPYASARSSSSFRASCSRSSEQMTTVIYDRTASVLSLSVIHCGGAHHGSAAGPATRERFISDVSQVIIPLGIASRFGTQAHQPIMGGDLIDRAVPAERVAIQSGQAARHLRQTHPLTHRPASRNLLPPICFIIPARRGRAVVHAELLENSAEFHGLALTPSCARRRHSRGRAGATCSRSLNEPGPIRSRSTSASSAAPSGTERPNAARSASTVARASVWRDAVRVLETRASTRRRHTR